MSYASFDPILTAIREVLQSHAGTARLITASTYYGRLFGSGNRDKESTDALVKPRIEATVTAVGNHPSSHNVMGSTLLRSITVDVRVVRHANTIHALDDTLRDDLKALAARDSDVVAQALTYPGNLTTDSSANATNLVSNCLIYQSSKVGKVELDGTTGGRVETVHTFSGVVKVTP